MKRVLVLAPNSAMRGWLKELQLEGEDSVVLLQGTKKKRKELLRGKEKWVLLNHEAWRVVPEIGNMAWDMVILDESASCIRYPRTQVTQYMLNRFQKAKRRVAMAGRPDPQNNLLAYWTQQAWVGGGRFMGCSSYWQFRASHFVQYGYRWVPHRGAKQKIMEAVSKSAYVLRREHVKLDVPKIFEPRWVSLSRSEQARYDKAEERFILDLEDGTERSTQWKIVQYQWLRQLASGFVDKARVDNGKWNQLKEDLEGELCGDQVVVWCAYNHEIADLADRLGRQCTWIDGSVPTQERHKRVEKWEKGDVKILVVQVRCAETGEDLGVADTAIYYSLPFGGLTWIQTQDRILGNLTKEGVLISPILCEGTIDEDIWAALNHQDAKGREFLDLIRESMRRRHARSEVRATSTR